MGKPVLVMGGAGYIGAHACKALVGAGYLPVTYDNLSSGHATSVQWGPLERGDILDPIRLDAVFDKYRPVAVMHFAAFSYVGESVTDPAKYYRNNVAGTLSLLEAMRKARVCRIVFSSTCAIYGTPASLPISEDELPAPISPYGASKWMVERMLADFRAAYGVEFVALRYFNAAGADPDGQVGEDHDPETHLVPLVLDAASGRRPHVTVFGDDYPTSDGTCRRDYVHVSDLAQAHVLALQRLEAGNSRSCYNLGTGTAVSVHQLIAVAAKITGCRIPVITGPRRAGDPAELLADPTLAHTDLGWQPRLSSLEDIIATAWAWHQRRGAAALTAERRVASGQAVSR